MKRIIFICEGPTEQAFCKTNLQAIFQEKGIYIQTPLIKSSKGGAVKWQILKQQIETHLKSEKTAFVTTFIDYYGLYSKYNFPNWEIAEKIQDKNKRMEALEKGMHESIAEDLRYRFIPYLQLHEFEGLMFNDINVFYTQIPTNDLINKEALEKTFAEYDNPEMINNNRETSPSHRLIQIIKGYHKVVYGDILAEAIGITKIRKTNRQGSMAGYISSKTYKTANPKALQKHFCKAFFVPVKARLLTTRNPAQYSRLLPICEFRKSKSPTKSLRRQG